MPNYSLSNALQAKYHVCQISILPGRGRRTAAVNVKTEERTLIHPERREQLNKIKAMATTWTAKAGRWAREAPGASAPVLGHLGDNKLNVAAAKERGEIVDFVPKLVNPIPTPSIRPRNGPSAPS